MTVLLGYSVHLTCHFYPKNYSISANNLACKFNKILTKITRNLRKKLSQKVKPMLNVTIKQYSKKKKKSKYKPLFFMCSMYGLYYTRLKREDITKKSCRAGVESEREIAQRAGPQWALRRCAFFYTHIQAWERFPTAAVLYLYLYTTTSSVHRHTGLMRRILARVLVLFYSQRHTDTVITHSCTRHRESSLYSFLLPFFYFIFCFFSGKLEPCMRIEYRAQNARATLRDERRCCCSIRLFSFSTLRRKRILFAPIATHRDFNFQNSLLFLLLYE